MFEALTGFREESPEQVRAQITPDGEALKSRVNGRVMCCGRLETPSLAELRERARTVVRGQGRLTVPEVVADVQTLHRDAANAGALFQVASQFNLLEMVSPERTPEEGVGIYEYDRTQVTYYVPGGRRVVHLSTMRKNRQKFREAWCLVL